MNEKDCIVLLRVDMNGDNVEGIITDSADSNEGPTDIPFSICIDGMPDMVMMTRAAADRLTNSLAKTFVKAKYEIFQRVS